MNKKDKVYVVWRHTFLLGVFSTLCEVPKFYFKEPYEVKEMVASTKQNVSPLPVEPMSNPGDRDYAC